MSNIFQIQQASGQNLPILQALMRQSIEILQKKFLSDDQIQASYEVMGLDTQLIEDGTYFSVWAETTLVGCGGWSARKTLYGGNHSKGRSDERLNPPKDAARIRAMYTHPDWARRGIGRLILETCESAARNAGFTRAQMMATLSGVPLYEACGYTKIKPHTDFSQSGIEIPLMHMEKILR